jgi:small neutral amino acid transporter SnatA (MarC family)
MNNRKANKKSAYNSFHAFMRNKYALSEVVSTLIILVISVLLAGAVMYFAINVVSTRVQEESLSLSNAHVWLNPAASSGTPRLFSGFIESH